MPIEGGSDSNPLRLDGVAAKDFKALLGYLFPLWVLLAISFGLPGPDHATSDPRALRSP
jgi:hypothetical protein